MRSAPCGDHPRLFTYQVMIAGFWPPARGDKGSGWRAARKCGGSGSLEYGTAYEMSYRKM